MPPDEQTSMDELERSLRLLKVAARDAQHEAQALADAMREFTDTVQNR